MEFKNLLSFKFILPFCVAILMLVSVLVNIFNNIFTYSSWVSYEKIIVILLNFALILGVYFLSRFHLKSKGLFERISFGLFFVCLAIFYNLLSFSNDAAFPTIAAMLIAVMMYFVPVYLALFGVNWLVKKYI